jgi:hypothetical protein
MCDIQEYTGFSETLTNSIVLNYLTACTDLDTIKYIHNAALGRIF